MEWKVTYRCPFPGIRGYLTATLNSEQFIKAIRVVSDGAMWVERKITAKAFSRLVSIRNVKQELLKSNLTRREGEIVRLVIQGYSTKHISTVLGIRKQTVKNYLRNIFKKFGVSNRIHLVAKILGEGIPQLHSMINVSGVSINARPKTTNRC